MEEKIKNKLNISLNKFDYLLLLLLNLSLVFLLYRDEKYLWIIFISSIVLYLIYKQPALLPALAIQLFGVYNFFLEEMGYSSINRFIFLFGFVISILILFQGYNHNFLRTLKSPLILLIGFFTLLWINSLEGTLSPRYGHQKVTFHIMFNLPLLLQFLIIRIDENFIKKLATFIIIATIMFSFHSLIYINEFGFRFRPYLNYFGINPIWVGRIYGIGILSSVYLIYANNSKVRLTYLLTSIYFFFFMILLMKRGPLLALLVTVLLMIYFNQKKISIINNYVIILSLFFLTSIILWWDDIFLMFSSFGSTKDISSLYRIQMLKLFTKVINSVEWFGVGAGSFSKISVGQDTRWYPHNLFIETYLEAGIIALLVLFLILFVHFYEFLKFRKVVLNNDPILHSLSFAYLIFLFGLINAQVSGDLYSNRFIWIGLGLSISLIEYIKIAFTSKSSSN